MSADTDHLNLSHLGEETTNRPIIALITEPGEGDMLAGSILRARREGFSVVVVTNRHDIEALDFARQLDTPVLVPEDDVIRGPTANQRLVEEARSSGFPGVVIHDDLDGRIDYGATAETLRSSDRYVVDAEVSPTVERDVATLVAIPAYNEESSIREVVAETRDYVDDVLVVDDGSSDETSREAVAAGATVVNHESNRGYGAALKTAFGEAERAGVDHLVVIDGDGQHAPADIPDLVCHQQETGADVVIGSRFVDGSKTDLPFYRRVGLYVINTLTNLSMGVVRPRSRVRDTQSGFRAYSASAIRTLAEDDAIGDRMDASTDVLYHSHREDYRIDEVGAEVRYDVEAPSTHAPLTHGFVLLRNILRTVERERPILILGLPGFLSLAVGIGFGYWTLSNYIASTTFPMGLAVVSVFFVLVGMFLSFTGIILHSLSTHNEAC